MLRNPRVQGTGDALLAAILAVTSVVPVLSGDPSWGQPKSLGVALALLSTVPIAWRARRPLLAAAIVARSSGHGLGLLLLLQPGVAELEHRLPAGVSGNHGPGTIV